MIVAPSSKLQDVQNVKLANISVGAMFSVFSVI